MREKEGKEGRAFFFSPWIRNQWTGKGNERVRTIVTTTLSYYNYAGA
jgi:hypothetical protein